MLGSSVPALDQVRAGWDGVLPGECIPEGYAEGRSVGREAATGGDRLIRFLFVAVPADSEPSFLLPVAGDE
jgi:hypothetical protein